MPRRASATSFGGKAGNPRNTTKPGSGAPPEAFKMRLQTLIDREQTCKAIATILSDPDHPHFMRALDYATNHAYGKPKETVEQTGAVEILVRFVEEPLS